MHDIRVRFTWLLESLHIFIVMASELDGYAFVFTPIIQILRFQWYWSMHKLIILHCKLWKTQWYAVHLKHMGFLLLFPKFFSYQLLFFSSLLTLVWNYSINTKLLFFFFVCFYFFFQFYLLMWGFYLFFFNLSFDLWFILNLFFNPTVK